MPHRLRDIRELKKTTTATGASLTKGFIGRTRTTTWNSPWPSGTQDFINIVNPRTPPHSSVEANTDVIHNKRQKTLKVSSVLLFRHILNTKSWLECCFSLLNLSLAFVS